MARRGYLWRAGALGAALSAVLSATGCGTHRSEPAPPARAAQSAPQDALSSRIGVLSIADAQGGGSTRSCTASVVDSPRRDLLVTAAHCVYRAGEGPADGLTFLPGYRNGASPQGSWPIDRIVVDQHWQDQADPEYDVAFLTVQPVDGRRIEDVLGGGNALGVNRGFDLPVTVTGYPFDHEEPVTCATRTTAQSSTQQRFDCGGFSDGTSGSPWLTGVDPATGTGTVVGVIGGYQQGGDTPDTSYSVSFDDRVSALYAQAVG